MRACALGVSLLVLAGCSCQRQADGRVVLQDPGDIGVAAAATAANDAGAQAHLDALREHAAATTAAVSMVHAYLGALAAGDLPRADAHWTGGKPGARPGDQPLRAIQGLSAIRIDNGAPTPLDAEAPPRALQVPVTLRISHAEGSSHMTGSYRVRRKVDGETWEITSADLRASLR